MSKTAKFMSILALSGGLVAILGGPASALSLIAPVEGSSSTQSSAYGNAPVAFVGGANGAGSENSSLLSTAELMHVQWCAERYTSSYHASDNTYATSKGTRVECRSPY
jgi:hypothetical protein